MQEIIIVVEKVIEIVEIVEAYQVIKPKSLTIVKTYTIK
jgi:hypothetical protein